MDDAQRSAMRQIALLFAIAVPIAVLTFLTQAEFFDAYEGVAVAHRPAEGSDGRDDPLRRFVIEHADKSSSEVLLPTAAFKGANLPFSQYGAAPLKTPDNAVPVKKSRFQMAVVIGTQKWPTLRPADFIVPLLGLIAVLLIRNVVMTGSPFEFVATGKSALPGIKRPPDGQPERGPRKERPKKGPPPPRGKRGRGRRR